MTDECGNCGAEITEGGIFKGSNKRLANNKVAITNLVTGHEYTTLCEKCGSSQFEAALLSVRRERDDARHYLKENITDFPMMTISQVPPTADCRIISMVTGNVTVGTGLFSELSQQVSDLFGATNTASGMALKVNSGEATARSIVVNKAMALGANCIIGVDIDYGTTTNNAATVNMQGTAVVISNLDDVFSERVLERFRLFEEKRERMEQLDRLSRGDIEPA
ncbi:uncharacterized protein YbjQ (UPF0145 family) [Novosphingobium gossypii]